MMSFFPSLVFFLRTIGVKTNMKKRKVKIGSYHELVGPLLTTFAHKFMITADPLLLIC
jgi:hypothetical protein